MTAFAGLAKADCIEVLTDTAHLDIQTGCLKERADKAIVAASGRFVIFGAGPAYEHRTIGDFLARWLDSFSSVDAALERLPSLLADDSWRPLRMIGDTPADANCFYVAAISETRGPLLHAFVTEPWLGMEAWTLTPAGRLVVFGQCSADDIDAAGVDTAGLWNGLAERGAALFEAFRNSPVTDPRLGVPGMVTVGGELVLHTLTAEGVRRDVLKTWQEDVIGRRLKSHPNFRPVCEPVCVPV